MNCELLIGWKKLPDFKNRGETYWNDEREMLIISNNIKSTLVKENEIHLEFTEKEHFSDALKKSDAIWAAEYAILN